MKRRNHPRSLDESAALKLAAIQATKQSPATTPEQWQQMTLPDTVLWSKQREIHQAIHEHNRVAVKSCHDSGKSYIAAVITSWWLDTHPYGSARVITTAPTHDQVKGILWVEINKLRAENPQQLPGKTNQTEWWIGGFLAGVGRKPSDYNPAAFQGLHARYMLIVIDEAAAVTTSLINAAETIATNKNAKILMIGNPDDPNSAFADICHNPETHGYHTITIRAWDTPNFTDEYATLPDYLNDSLLSAEWVERRRKVWGVDHPFWQSKIEAEFPEIDAQSTIKLHDVIRARIPFTERDPTHHNKTPQATDPEYQKQPTLGVDVAGSDTGDETVCRLIMPPNSPTLEHTFRSSDPNKVAAEILNQIILTRPRSVIVDSVGVGFGIIGTLRLLLKDINDPTISNVKVIGFNGAQAASKPKLYGNARAELWWEARLMFQNGLIDTSRADGQMDLEAQLIAPRYHINKGRIWVEDKDEIRKRIGRSPDNADAFLYALSQNLSSGIITLNTQPNMALMARHSVPQLASAHTTSLRLVKPRA